MKSHGHTHRRKEGGMSKEYRTWTNLKSRCNNPKSSKYATYGGRGISVCAAWNQSFEAFYADMGAAPDGCSLDRIDPNGKYEPGNCRWVTQTDQCNNRRNNRRLTIGDRTMTAAQWAQEPGAVVARVIYERLSAGWEASRAVFAPTRKVSKANASVARDRPEEVAA